MHTTAGGACRIKKLSIYQICVECPKYSSTSKHKLDLAAALSHPSHYFLSIIKKEPFMIIQLLKIEAYLFKTLHNNVVNAL